VLAVLFMTALVVGVALDFIDLEPERQASESTRELRRDEPGRPHRPGPRAHAASSAADDADPLPPRFPE
jgi:hypothetical protein